MAPIEPEFFNSNVKPIVLLSIYAGVTASLVALIAHRVFHAAHRALPPAMANRVRQGRRRRHILLYTALSLISLGVATYWRVQQVRQSYNVWAYERGYTVPGALWTDDTAKWEFGRWLQDTNFDDVWEIALEKSRRRWWTSQYFFSITIWSFFVSVEG